MLLRRKQTIKQTERQTDTGILPPIAFVEDTNSRIQQTPIHFGGMLQIFVYAFFANVQKRDVSIKNTN